MAVMGRLQEFICFILNKNKKPYSGDPRPNYYLKQLINMQRKIIICMLHLNLKFFLLKKDNNGMWIPADNTGYFSLSPHDTADHIKKRNG